MMLVNIGPDANDAKKERKKLWNIDVARMHFDYYYLFLFLLLASRWQMEMEMERIKKKKRHRLSKCMNQAGIVKWRYSAEMNLNMH